MSAAGDDALSHLAGGTVVGVDFGENSKGWQDLWVYLKDGGAVAISAEGCRDVEQPFEHGAKMWVEFFPNARWPYPELE